MEWRRRVRMRNVKECGLLKPHERPEMELREGEFRHLSTLENGRGSVLEA
jgi:hypothetical protein